MPTKSPAESNKTPENSPQPFWDRLACIPGAEPYIIKNDQDVWIPDILGHGPTLLAPEYVIPITDADGTPTTLRNQLVAIIKTNEGEFWSFSRCVGEPLGKEPKTLFLFAPVALPNVQRPDNDMRVVSQDSTVQQRGSFVQIFDKATTVPKKGIELLSTGEWRLGALVETHRVGQTTETDLLITQDAFFSDFPVETTIYCTLDPAAQKADAPLLLDPREWCPDKSIIRYWTESPEKIWPWAEL